MTVLKWVILLFLSPLRITYGVYYPISLSPFRHLLAARKTALHFAFLRNVSSNFRFKHVCVQFLFQPTVHYIQGVPGGMWNIRESVPYVKLYWYNPKHLYPKLNGYGDYGQRSLKLWQLLHTYWLPNTYWNWKEYVVSVMLISVHNIKVTCEWHKAIKLNYKNSRTNTCSCL